MNYVLALFLPPLSILFAGRPFVAVITFLIWIPAVIFSAGSPIRCSSCSPGS
jgi:hypothetical protein